MKKALISTSESVQYLSSWEKFDGKRYFPLYSTCGARVAEVTDVQFEVAPPLFWVDCGDEVTAEQYYYNLESKTVAKIPDPAPYPVEVPVEPTGEKEEL